MPITRELKYPHSAASRWLSTNFDLNEAVVWLNSQVKECVTIRPEGHLKDYPWSTVGHAVELGLDQALGINYYETPGPVVPSQLAWDAGLYDAVALIWDEGTQQAITTPEKAWMLYFAGVFEGLVYGGGYDQFEDRYRGELSLMMTSSDWEHFRVQMRQLRQGYRMGVDSKDHPCIAQLPELLPVAQKVLGDIMRVCDAMLSSTSYFELIQSGSLINWPIFSGGAWVGGADGDFIVEHTLFDVKATIHPERLWVDALRQMIAYISLDTQDEFGLDEIAIFLPRQHGAVARIPLDMILSHSTFQSRWEMQMSMQMALDPMLAH